MSTSAATFKAAELSYPFIISLSLSLSLWYILNSKFPSTTVYRPGLRCDRDYARALTEELLCFDLASSELGCMAGLFGCR